MAHLKTQFPVASMSGKVSKSDEIYTKTRRIDQATFAVALKNPATNQPPTRKQARAQRDMKTARAAVDAALMNPTEFEKYDKAWRSSGKKYKTLRGYIFHEVYTQSSDI